MIKRTVLMGVAVVAVGAVSLAGVSLASAHAPGDAPPGSEVKDRVAEILGVGRSTLDEAIVQARGEVREEHLAAKLDEAVASGAVTEGEAAEIKAWLEARPQILDEIGPMAGPRHGPGRHGRGGPGSPAGMAGLSSSGLDYLVENGVITQEQADEISAWQEARPEATDRLRPRIGAGEEFGRGHDRGHRAPPWSHGGMGRSGVHGLNIPTPGAEQPAELPAPQGTSM